MSQKLDELIAEKNTVSNSKLIDARDIEAAADEMAARIRESFVKLIPDERWKQLVQDEITKFITEGTIVKQYGPNEKVPSKFSVIVQQHLNEVAAARIKEEVEKVLKDKTFDIEHLVQEWLNNYLIRTLSGALQSAMAIGIRAQMEYIIKKMPDPRNEGYDLSGNPLQY